MTAEVLGEFLGTMILILMGGGVCAGVSLEKTYAKGAGWMAITAGWAFAVVCGVAVSQFAGGPGSLNPAGTIAGVIGGSVDIVAALVLITAQLAGAFCGACLVWLAYLPHWKPTQDQGTKLGIFCTGPAIPNTTANLLSEAIGTFALILIATAITASAEGAAIAPLVGIVVWSIGLSLGSTTGYAINPARDLGPRLAHALLPIPGKGDSNWGYAWIPIVGPVLGAVVAAILVQAIAAEQPSADPQQTAAATVPLLPTDNTTG